MSKIVYKIELPEPGKPKECIFPYAFISLHIALQNHKPMLWFESSVGEQRHTEVQLICVGTGWPIEEQFWYLGTVITESGFVWHFYAKYLNDDYYE